MPAVVCHRTEVLSGAAVAYVLFNGYTVSTLAGGSFSQTAFAFAVTGEVVQQGLTLALLGKIGSSVIQGALAMGILAVALIPAAYAFSLLSEVDK